LRSVRISPVLSMETMVAEPLTFFGAARMAL
jgi:hypothetical protein